MNRILKRPMFRIGGSSGTGITSGLDRTGYAGRKPTFKEYLEGLSKEQKQMQQENLFRDYQDFLKRQQVAEQKTMAADGGRIGYANGTQMPTFQTQGLPGFLTSFGLNLLSTPPQGNIFATAATAAKGPFNQLMADQTAAGKTAAEREFLRGEREASDEAAMERLKIKLQSDKDIASMTKGNALYQVSLEGYLEDGLPPLAAERAANFATTLADELRGATKNKYGGVLTFDIRDPNNQKQVRKNLNGKVVYDPIEDNYKYIVVRDGEVFFDEFDSIADIRFPDLTTIEPKEKTDRSNKMFGLDMDDPQP